MTHHEIPYRNMNEYEFRYQEEILRQMLLEKFLQAMREDLSEWLSSLSHHVSISADNFLNDLENGIILCQHARLIQRYAEEYAVINSSQNVKIPTKQVFYKERGAFPGSFVARDNVANFIAWCRELGIPEVLMFESDDLILQKNEKSVILTLMEVARKAYIFGVQPPEIVRFEKEIDEEIDKEKEAVLRGKPPQKPRDLEEDNNLDTMVRNIVNKCQCYDRFPIKKLAEGKYQVGRNAALIFVRVMRKHVMVRVGGGWDTFDHYITKHDPCRTKVMGTIDGDGHTKSQLPADSKLNSKMSKAEHTVATSTDTSSMCSSSSEGSEGMCQCDRKVQCNHRNSMASDIEVNNENADPSANFTRSIEEIDKKLKLLENRKPSLDISMKDPMVYDNKSDRWLRSHLNTIKQNNQPNESHTCSNPQANFKMQRGYTADHFDREERKLKDQCDRTPKALRRRSNNNNPTPKGKGKQTIQRQLSYQELRQPTEAKSTSKKSYDHTFDTQDGKQTVLSPVSSIDSSSIKSEPIRRSCNDMSTQTDFNDDDIKSSKIPRPMLRDSSNSRIPRPVMIRSKTSDAIPLRKKKSQNTPNNCNSNYSSSNNASNNSNGSNGTRTAIERPVMRREKSDIPTSMRREKSNLSARNSKKTVPRGPAPTSSTATPRKDKSRAEAPVRIRNGPELRV